MMERGSTVSEQYVTRTLQFVEICAWRPTGELTPDGLPAQEKVASVETVVTRMNNGLAREILRANGCDCKGCQVVWKVTDIATYALPLEVFFSEARRVERAVNGSLTFIE